MRSRLQLFGILFLADRRQLHGSTFNVPAVDACSLREFHSADVESGSAAEVDSG